MLMNDRLITVESNVLLIIMARERKYKGKRTLKEEEEIHRIRLIKNLKNPRRLHKRNVVRNDNVLALLTQSNNKCGSQTTSRTTQLNDNDPQTSIAQAEILHVRDHGLEYR